MSKSLSNSNLSERPAIRPLLAIFLCTSMAAFGCTTDRNLGNGDPVTTPGVRSTPTGGTSAGSESEPVPPPMMSSYSDGSHPRIARLSADQAAAIMAQQQRVKVLGPASPNNGGRPYASDRVMMPAQQYGSQSSINSTIYSGPTAAISSGAGEAVVTTDAAANFLDTGSVAVGDNGSAVIAGSSVATGTTASGSTTVTNAAGPVITPTGTTITPTSSAVSTPAAFASVRTLSPTAAAVVNPPASISGSPALATTSSSRTAGTAANRTVTTTSAPTTANANTGNTTTNVGVTNPVRVLNSNGRVTITNSTTTTSRQQ